MVRRAVINSTTLNKICKIFFWSMNKYRLVVLRIYVHFTYENIFMNIRIHSIMKKYFSHSHAFTTWPTLKNHHNSSLKLFTEEGEHLGTPQAWTKSTQKLNLIF